MGKIVIADEVFTVRESLAICLRGEHDVKTASSWNEAVEAAPQADLLIAGFSRATLDRRAQEALERLPPRCRILLLGQPIGCDLTRLTGRSHAVAFLTKPFDISVLREEIRSLLSRPQSPEVVPSEKSWRRFLEPPFVPAKAAFLLGRALSCDIPILLVGEKGTGKRRIAHALHRLRGGRHLLHLTPDDYCKPLHEVLYDRLPKGATLGALTLYLEDVEALGTSVQTDLLSVLDPGMGGLGSAIRLWVVASSTKTADALAATGRFSQELAYRLGSLCVHLPPLRERGAELPTLIELVGSLVSEKLALQEPIRLSPSALQLLSRYFWFGNLPELESVLARSAALNPGGEITEEALRFTALEAEPLSQVVPAQRELPSAPTPLFSSPALAAVEALIGQLAHELKNPMVTIKTFAQQAHAMLADPASLADFQRLVNEAVERMDELLERLLEFSRYRQPVPQEIDLGEVAAAALARVREALIQRGVEIREHLEAGCWARGDERQVGFALTLLFEALLSELRAGAAVEVSAAQDGGITISASSDYSPIRDLSELGASPAHDAGFTLAPLRAALAALLIERNGGSLVRESREGTKTVVSIRMPGDANTLMRGGGGDGKATRLDRR